MENHTLVHEFPEFESKISEMKQRDSVFRSLYVNYEEVNALIQHYEENHPTDEHLNELRKKRVFLKDQLSQYLTNK